MKQRPILFSGAMVRAILEGRKTQTRRVVNVGKGSDCSTMLRRPVCDEAGTEFFMKAAHPNGSWSPCSCPYGVPGDRLWVRETHITGWPSDGGEIQRHDEDGNELPMHVWYRATPEPDGSYVSSRGERIVSWLDENERTCDRIPWRPSIHMPRVASRITLEVVSVRVERLQEISEADAIAEGCGRPENGTLAVLEYSRLWDEINGPGSWAWNPWVWVIEFKRVTEGGGA